MNQWKSVWGIIITALLLLIVGGIAATPTITVDAATESIALPYEYTFEKDANKKFNGISSMNKLVITFDKDIKEFKPFNEHIKIVQGKQKTPMDNFIDTMTITGKKLTITFKNIDFRNYTDDKLFDYELIIDKETLRFDQLDEYHIPILIYDILPGFKSTFIDTEPGIINTNIFKDYAPRQIFVHIPKIYITGIETIHRYNGLLGPDPTIDNTEDKDGTKDPINNGNQVNPHLTNIDVFADKDATRLKVSFNGNDDNEYSRDLMRNPKVFDGFTMGQAGIDAIMDKPDDPNDQEAGENDFYLRAYNDKGRFLEQRRFKLKIYDQENDFIINDYIEAPTNEFGQTYSLYDLMIEPELLKAIIERIPVSQLDTLGVTYSVAKNSVEVSNSEELEIALANPNITNIKLTNDITLKSPLTINSTIEIDAVKGNDQNDPNNDNNKDDRKYAVTGNIILGTGIQDITVKLNNLKIDGDLTIDVGSNGTAILDKVTVVGTKIPGTGNTIINSGGSNSVHMNKFITNNIKINNTSLLRVVITDSDDLVVNGNTDVILEINSLGNLSLPNGTFEKVVINNVENINLGDTTKIKSFEGPKDSELYKAWVELSKGSESINIPAAIKAIQNADAATVVEKLQKLAKLKSRELDFNTINKNYGTEYASISTTENTLQKIQAYINKVNALEAIDAMAANKKATALTTQLLQTAGVTGIVDANLPSYKNAVASNSKDNLDTTAELQALIDYINALEAIDAMAAKDNADSLTIQLLKTAGVTGTIDTNLSFYKKAVINKSLGSLNTTQKVQALVNVSNALEEIDAMASMDNGNALTIELLNAAGATGIVDAYLPEYRAAIESKLTNDLDTTTNLQKLIDCVNALEVIDNMAASNNATTLTIKLLQTAGVTGIVNSSLSEYKIAVSSKSKNDLDTTEEVQALINDVNARILANT